MSNELELKASESSSESSSKSQDLIVTTNHKSPLSIEGISKAVLEEGTAYFCLYRICGVLKKYRVNQQLFEALQLVWREMQADNEGLIHNWINAHAVAEQTVDLQEQLYEQVVKLLKDDLVAFEGEEERERYLAFRAPLLQALDKLQIQWRHIL
jgi:hypothetical protein